MILNWQELDKTLPDSAIRHIADTFKNKLANPGHLHTWGPKAAVYASLCMKPR